MSLINLSLEYVYYSITVVYNAIYFLIIFSIPCKQFTKILLFAFTPSTRPQCPAPAGRSADDARNLSSASVAAPRWACGTRIFLVMLRRHAPRPLSSWSGEVSPSPLAVPPRPVAFAGACARPAPAAGTPPGPRRAGRRGRTFSGAAVAFEENGTVPSFSSDQALTYTSIAMKNQRCLVIRLRPPTPFNSISCCVQA